MDAGGQLADDQGWKGKVRMKAPPIAAILDPEKSLRKLKITSLWGSLS